MSLKTRVQAYLSRIFGPGDWITTQRLTCEVTEELNRNIIRADWDKMDAEHFEKAVIWALNRTTERDPSILRN